MPRFKALLKRHCSADILASLHRPAAPPLPITSHAQGRSGGQGPAPAPPGAPLLLCHPRQPEAAPGENMKDKQARQCPSEHKEWKSIRKWPPRGNKGKKHVRG